MKNLDRTSNLQPRTINVQQVHSLNVQRSKLLYPQAWQDITKSYGQPAFYSEVGLHGRYTLQMKVPFQLGADGVAVVSYGKPEFYLHEVESIEELGDGRLQIRSAKDSARHLRFGSNE